MLLANAAEALGDARDLGLCLDVGDAARFLRRRAGDRALGFGGVLFGLSACGLLGCRALSSYLSCFIRFADLFSLANFLRLARFFGAPGFFRGPRSLLGAACFLREAPGLGTLGLLGLARLFGGSLLGRDAQGLGCMLRLFGLAGFLGEAGLLGRLRSFDLARFLGAFLRSFSLTRFALYANGIEASGLLLEFAALLGFGAGATQHLGFVSPLSLDARGLLASLLCFLARGGLALSFGARRILGKAMGDRMGGIGRGVRHGWKLRSEQDRGKRTGETRRPMKFEMGKNCATLRIGHSPLLPRRDTITIGSADRGAVISGIRNTE